FGRRPAAAASGSRVVRRARNLPGSSRGRLRVEQWQASLRVDLPPDGPGRRGQYQFQCGANRRLEQVPATGRAVPQAEDRMDVEEWLALVEGEVADQRQDLGLPFLAVPQVGLFQWI